MITSSQIARLEKLTELRDKGALTSEEFEQHKQAILAPPPPRAANTFDSTAIKKRLVGDVDLGEFETHLRWMILPLQNYANFTGRSGRREYWMFTLGVAVIYAILYIMFESALREDNAFTGIFSLGMAGLIAIALFLPALAVQVRRLHDQDKPGWWVLINLVPYLGAIIVLILMCLEGTDGPNRYGDDPSTI